MTDLLALVQTINTFYPETTERELPLHEPDIGVLEEQRVIDCLRSGWVSTAGPSILEFESLIRDYTGAKAAVATANGTSALHLAFLAVGVGQNDLVITPAISFAATANAVRYCGAEPVFLDVDSRLGLDPLQLRRYLYECTELRNGQCWDKQSSRRVAAVVVVHVLGIPSAVDELLELAREFGLKLVEDAAEALGSFRRGVHCGLIGDIGILSFNGNKVITTGGGGVVISHDTKLISRVRHLSTQAKVAHAFEFDHDELGYNYRMPNLNAALGCAQMQRLPYLLEQKRGLAMALREFLSSDGVEWLDCEASDICNYWLNAIRIPGMLMEKRDWVLDGLLERRIMARPLWKPLHLLAYNRYCRQESLICAMRQYQEVICLPSSAALCPEGVRQ